MMCRELSYLFKKHFYVKEIVYIQLRSVVTR